MSITFGEKKTHLISPVWEFVVSVPVILSWTSHLRFLIHLVALYFQVQGWGNPWYQYRLENEQIKSSTAKKDLGMLVHKRWTWVGNVPNTSWAAWKAWGQQWREAIPPFCSALVTPHLCIVLGSPAQDKKWTCWCGFIGGTWRWLDRLEQLFYEDRITELGLLNLEKAPKELYCGLSVLKGGG